MKKSKFVLTALAIAGFAAGMNITPAKAGLCDWTQIGCTTDTCSGLWATVKRLISGRPDTDVTSNGQGDVGYYHPATQNGMVWRDDGTASNQCPVEFGETCRDATPDCEPPPQ